MMETKLPDSVSINNSTPSFFVIGLPFKYRTASTFVTRSISDIGVVFRSDWLILITEIFSNLP